MRSIRSIHNVVVGAFLALFFIVLSSGVLLRETESFAVPATISVGSEAEWLPPREVLVHLPGEEIFFGVIHPAAALYEKPFSPDGAAAEHKEYVRLLRGQGARVHSVVETMLDGAVDKAGVPIKGQQLDALRELARRSIRVTCEGFDSNAIEEKKQQEYLSKTLEGLHPKELVRIILIRPQVHLRPTRNLNTGYAASYEASPVMNLYFMRDQMITTRKGVVIGRMHSEQRRVETEIAKFVLKKLGISPLYEVQGDGDCQKGGVCLEGGDFIPAGKIAFIGQGLRTTEGAVRQLLDKDVFGSETVVVVKDLWKNQAQLHLDTYFNIIAPDLAVMVETRMNRDAEGMSREVSPELRLRADVYAAGKGGYTLARRDVDFQAYLEEQGFRLIPVSNADQEKYGINFLTVGPRKILGIAGVSEAYKARLKANGVDATWMDFSNLTGGYGAAHCTVQVLRRAL